MFRLDKAEWPSIKLNKVIIYAMAFMTSGMLLVGCKIADSDSASAGQTSDVQNAVSSLPTTVTELSGADIDSSGAPGAKITDIDNSAETDGTVLITEGGVYRISGRLDATVVVDADENPVHIILDDAYIDSVSGPALRIVSAAKVILTVRGNNTLKDSAGYLVEDDADGCIESKSDLTINGDGTLNVNGYHKDAIRCRDRVRILGGNISVIAKRNAIKANDGVLICGATVKLESEKDGLVTNKTGKRNKGLIEIVNSEVSIVTGGYGINSKADILIYESNVTDRSVLGHYKAGNNVVIEDGCLQ